MHRRQKPYWAWTEDEWLEVLCPTERDFHLRHKWSGNCRQYAVAVSYLLCGFSKINEIGTFFQSRLAIKVFGRETIEAAVQRVQEELKGVGYGSRIKFGVPHALYSAMLLNRSPRLEDLTKEVLETVWKQCTSVFVKRGAKTLSQSLVRMGILTEPLSHSLVVKKAPDRYQAEADVPAEWLCWCKKWLDITCPSPKVRICRKHWISRLAPNIVGEMISGLIACISAFFSAFSQHRDLTWRISLSDNNWPSSNSAALTIGISCK